MLMRPSLLCMALALAACAPAPPAVQTAAQESASVPRAAVSANAISVTGGLTIERGGLVFAHGATLYTRLLNPRRPTDAISLGGASYAATAGNSLAAAVEFRRVTHQDIRSGARNREGLCGVGVAPSYVALLEDSRGLSLLVFTGDAPPGPEATGARICAVYAYAPAT
jgi:hypothetical protein